MYVRTTVGTAVLPGNFDGALREPDWYCQRPVNGWTVVDNAVRS